MRYAIPIPKKEYSNPDFDKAFLKDDILIANNTQDAVYSTARHIFRKQDIGRHYDDGSNVIESIEYTLDNKHVIREVIYCGQIGQAMRIRDDDHKNLFKKQYKGLSLKQDDDIIFRCSPSRGLITYVIQSRSTGQTTHYCSQYFGEEIFENILPKLKIDQIEKLKMYSTRLQFVGWSLGFPELKIGSTFGFGNNKIDKESTWAISSLLHPIWGIGHPLQLSRLIHHLHSCKNNVNHDFMIPAGKLDNYEIINNSSIFIKSRRSNGIIGTYVSLDELFKIAIFYYTSGYYQNYLTPDPRYPIKRNLDSNIKHKNWYDKNINYKVNLN